MKTHKNTFNSNKSENNLQNKQKKNSKMTLIFMNYIANVF